jgi:phthalate 4,5-cis-dihydrodiol dehydrogenase
MGWIAESGMPKNPDQYGAARAVLRRARSQEDELALKYAARDNPQDNSGRLHQHFGFVVASCDYADLRPLPDGVAIYGDEVRRFDALPAPVIHRSAVLDEFCGAVMDGKPALRDGVWGMATMEVCLAMLQSAREQREVILMDRV